MESPLAEWAIFRQLKHRVKTYIFLCVLAYHLLVAIEKTVSDQGIHTSRTTVRQTLSTHHVLTVVLPTLNGDILHIRRHSKPDLQVERLYKQLGVSTRIMKPIKPLY